jgi:hypothetical protein
MLSVACKSQIYTKWWVSDSTSVIANFFAAKWSFVVLGTFWNKMRWVYWFLHIPPTFRLSISNTAQILVAFRQMLLREICVYYISVNFSTIGILCSSINHGMINKDTKVKFIFQLLKLTHSVTWALLEKPPIVQLLKNFPAFYGTRRFITVFTRALHWSLFWARSIQSIPSHPI